MNPSPDHLAEFPAKVGLFFDSIRAAINSKTTNFKSRLTDQFGRLQSLLDSAQVEIRQHEQIHASRFTVFDYIAPNENRLSEILADMLDPRGKHGQGPVFLVLFLKRLGLDGRVPPMNARVWTEDPTTYLTNQRRRIDILIDCDNFGIGIENKPWAIDQKNQMSDYARNLELRYGESFMLVYLSDSAAADTSIDEAKKASLIESNQYRDLTYHSDLAAWLVECIDVCGADQYRYFLVDLKSYLVDFVNRTPQEEPIDESTQ